MFLTLWSIIFIIWPLLSLRFLTKYLDKKKGVFKKYLETVKRDTVVGNNFALDASRIYISQKCDIDHYFGLSPGDTGRKTGEAGIGIKSDHVRVIGRETVKIHAGAGQFENLGHKHQIAHYIKMTFLTDLDKTINISFSKEDLGGSINFLPLEKREVTIPLPPVLQGEIIKEAIIVSITK